MPTVKQLNRRRPDYHAEDWKLYEALYEGGRKIKALKEVLLPRRPVETEDWYALRLGGFHYMNRVAKVVDEFASSIFCGDLSVQMAREDEAAERPELPDEYQAFLGDPIGDGSGDLSSVLFTGWVKSQVRGEHFYAPYFDDVDLPAGATRADQEKAGGLSPRLREIRADAVLNLHRDENGLAWIMLRHRIESTDPLPSDEQAKSKLVWTLIDRKMIRTFELTVNRDVAEPEEGTEVAELPAKPHRWATARDGAGICPIVTLCASKTAWLIERIESIAVAETKKRNSLFWYEEICSYPQPYHLGDSSMSETGQERRANKARGAQFWLEGEKDDEYGYMEPTGSSLDHLAKRLEAFGHEIAEVVHQAASALGPKAADQVQSAASKVRDSVAKRLLAESFADDVRACAKEILELVAIARSEPDLEFEVAGLATHDIADLDLVVDEAMKVQSLVIPSPTFLREYAKKTARAVLQGTVTPEKLEAIGAELDKADEASFSLVSPNEETAPGADAGGGPPQ